MDAYDTFKNAAETGALKIARTMRDWTKKMIPGTVSLKRLAEADVDG